MIKQNLVVDALGAAYWWKKPTKGLIQHSHRDSKYCSVTYRALQESCGISDSNEQKRELLGQCA
jgi:transposase InsO family protein